MIQSWPNGGIINAAAGSDAKTRTAFGTATGQDLAAVGGFHAGTESVVAFAFQVAGLVRAFGGHVGTSIKWSVVNPQL
jgi:hypothetical protein